MRCAVNNCGNNNRKGNRNKWRYFHFPKDKQQLQKWIEFCERDILNTATACICNKHFTPDDFERNMQYELGFTRKNPTKLKPGSYPTVHGAKHKLLKSKKDQFVENQDYRTESFPRERSAESDDCIDSIYLNSDDDDLDNAAKSDSSIGQSDEVIEYSISQIEEFTVDNDNSSIREIELEIIDPFNPPTNDEEHLEIIDASSDSYIKHLETEVSTLKREVFFLKDERKKLVEEIQNLRRIVRGKESKAVGKAKNTKSSRMQAGNPKRQSVQKKDS